MGKHKNTMSLQEWLDVTETSYSAFARDVPCSTSYPRLLAQSLARPSYALATRIEALTSGAVPRSTWYPPETEYNKPQEIEDLEL